MPVTLTLAGAFVRAMRAERRISQRELAVLAEVPRSTIDRIECGATQPRFETMCRLADATGYRLQLCDRKLRHVYAAADPDPLTDCGGRQFPAHLRVVKTPGYTDPGRAWWGWHSIAWPLTDDWVPEWTFWKRRKPPAMVDTWDAYWPRVWDDAT